jgi:hypothetical protein
MAEEVPALRSSEVSAKDGGLFRRGSGTDKKKWFRMG